MSVFCDSTSMVVVVQGTVLVYAINGPVFQCLLRMLVLQACTMLIIETFATRSQAWASWPEEEWSPSARARRKVPALCEGGC
jgi:hypothetical protein